MEAGAGDGGDDGEMTSPPGLSSGEGWGWCGKFCRHSGKETTVYRPTQPTSVSVGLFCTVFVSSIPPFLLAVFRAQKGVKNEHFGPFFDFLEGAVFAPYPLYEKVSRRHIFGPY